MDERIAMVGKRLREACDSATRLARDLRRADWKSDLAIVERYSEIASDVGAIVTESLTREEAGLAARIAARAAIALSFGECRDSALGVAFVLDAMYGTRNQDQLAFGRALTRACPILDRERDVPGVGR